MNLHVTSDIALSQREPPGHQEDSGAKIKTFLFFFFTTTPEHPSMFFFCSKSAILRIRTLERFSHPKAIT